MPIPGIHVNYHVILGAVSMHCVNAILGTSSLHFTHLPQQCQSISSNLISSKKKKWSRVPFHLKSIFLKQFLVPLTVLLSPRSTNG